LMMKNMYHFEISDCHVLMLFAIGCAVLLKRDSRLSQNDTYSSSSKGA